MAELEASAAAAPWKKAPDDPDLSARVEQMEGHVAQLDVTHKKRVSHEKGSDGGAPQFSAVRDPHTRTHRSWLT